MSISLEPEKYYHIYNHANGYEDIFLEDENFRFFLNKYEKYISPVADTLAYCLMPNHFHFLIRIKEEKALRSFPKFFLTLEKLYSDFSTSKKSDSEFEASEKFLSKQFSNLFSSYTQSFNKLYGRRGSLFLKNFQRKEVSNDLYLKQLIVYTHNNPVHHGFRSLPEEWKYSSYNTLLGDEKTNLMRDFVIGLFDDKENFIYIHQQKIDLENKYSLE
jgi:putative transposase